MLQKVETAHQGYNADKDRNIEIDTGGVKDEPSAMVFKAGQSKRIWNELYKVIFTLLFKATSFPFFLFGLSNNTVSD